MSIPFRLFAIPLSCLILGVAACATAADGTAQPPPGSRVGNDRGTATDENGANGGDGNCAPGVDLASDPGNCGRCGRVCDDGTCNAGTCAPRLEVEATTASPGLRCIADFEVVGGTVFVRGSNTGAPGDVSLGRITNGKVSPMASVTEVTPGPHAALATDGAELFVLGRKEIDPFNHEDHVWRFAPTGDEIARTEVDRGLLPAATSLATNGKALAVVTTHGEVIVVDGARTRWLRTGSTGSSGNRIAWGTTDIFASTRGGVHRCAPGGSCTTVVEGISNTLSDFAVVDDALYVFEQGGPGMSLELRRFSAGASAATNASGDAVVTFDRALLEKLVPPGYSLAADAQASIRSAVASDEHGLVAAVSVDGLEEPPRAVTPRVVLVRIPASGEPRLLGASPDDALFDPSDWPRPMKVSGGRVYWRTGHCHNAPGTPVTRIYSLPI